MLDQPPQNQSFLERLKAKRAEVPFIERQEHHHNLAAAPHREKSDFLKASGATSSKASKGLL